MRSAIAVVAASLLVFVLTACDRNKPEINPAGVRGINYTPNYIGGFTIRGVGSDMSGGGPNIYPKQVNQAYSGGGAESCCIGIPAKWHPDMVVEVKWLADKLPYDENNRSELKWYAAKATIPPYKEKTRGFNVSFLPGDRILLLVLDTTMQEDWDKPPPDNDPYIAKGEVDLELTAIETMNENKRQLNKRRNEQYLKFRKAGASIDEASKLAGIWAADAASAASSSATSKNP